MYCALEHIKINLINETMFCSVLLLDQVEIKSPIQNLGNPMKTLVPMRNFPENLNFHLLHRLVITVLSHLPNYLIYVSGLYKIGARTNQLLPCILCKALTFCGS